MKTNSVILTTYSETWYQSDNPGIEPNKAIEERLNHYF